MEKPSFDLLRTNPDISFPDVRYNFFYWSHVPENVPALAEAVEGNGIVALESTGTTDEQGQLIDDTCARKIIHNHYLLANRVTHGEVTNSERETLRDYAKYKGRLSWLLAEELYDTGIAIVPVDRMQEDPGRIKMPDAHRLSHAMFAYRQGLVFRQLPEIGKALIRNNWSRRSIAVALGTRHFPVSLACNARGADVTETFMGNNRDFAIGHILGTSYLERGLTPGVISALAPRLVQYSGSNRYYPNTYEEPYDERDKEKAMERWQEKV
jgi:hypothetical protein